MTTSRQALTDKQITDLDKRAVELVGIVHGGGDAGDVARLTTNLTHTQLVGLAISCAAMADPDQPVSTLLAWLPPAPDPHHGWSGPERRAATAAHHRLRTHQQRRTA